MRHNFEEWQFTSPKKNTSACIPKANPTSSAIPIDDARATGSMLLSFSPSPCHYLHHSPCSFYCIRHPATPSPLGNHILCAPFLSHWAQLLFVPDSSQHLHFSHIFFPAFMYFTGLFLKKCNDEEFLHCFLQQKKERKLSFCTMKIFQSLDG